MHRILSTALLGFIFLTNSYAQQMSPDFNLTWADVELHLSKDSRIVDAFYKDGDYYVLRKEVIRGPGGWHYFFERFDQQLKRTKVEDISAKIDEENYTTIGFTKTGDDYVIFSYQINSQTKEETYYIQRLETDDMSVGKRHVVISNQREGKVRYRSLQFTPSPDGSFILGYSTEYDRKAKTLKFNCFVFDEKLELLWKREDYDITGKSITEVFIDNEANVSLAVSNSVNRRYYSYDPGTSISYDAGTTEKVDFIILSEEDVNEFNYEFKTYVPLDIMIHKNEDGNYLLAGYYTDKESHRFDGVFCVTLDPLSGEQLDQIEIKFSDDLMKEGESEKAQKKYDKGKVITNLIMKNILQHEDGSFSLVGENNWVDVNTSYNAQTGTTTTTYTYHYSDMIVTTIKDGEITGNVKVNKHASAGTRFKAYITMSFENNVYIFFNDNRQNLIAIDEQKGVLSANGKNRDKALSVVKIHNNEKSRMGIIDYGDKTYEPYRIYNLGYDIEMLENGEILAWTYKGKKKFALLRISPK